MLFFSVDGASIAAHLGVHEKCPFLGVQRPKLREEDEEVIVYLAPVLQPMFDSVNTEGYLVSW